MTMAMRKVGFTTSRAYTNQDLLLLRLIRQLRKTPQGHRTDRSGHADPQPASAKPPNVKIYRGDDT